MNNVKTLRNIIQHLLKEDQGTRKVLLKEDKNLLRSYLRHCIYEAKAEVTVYKKKKDAIRQIVRKLIVEAEATGGSPDTPTDITAINFLKNLLKNIIPNIEDDYKQLTSSKKQRVSFRKHILNAVENLLNSLDAEPEAVERDLEEITVKVGDSDKPEGFIDIYDDEKDDGEPEEEVTPEDDFVKGLEGRDLDKTGRNAAFEAFNKIKNQIENEYSKLDADTVVDGRDETEREIFRDYILLNMKLYFDKFEEDLTPDPEEPTTPSEEEFVRAGEQEPKVSDEIPPEPAVV